MEAHLERSRFDARYNLGESGGHPIRVGELLAGVGVAPDDAARTFHDTLLRDSPNWGRGDLRDAVAALHPGATRDEVLVTTGTSEALLLLFRHLRPRRVALAVPAFQLLYEIPRALDAELVPLRVRWGHDGLPTIDRAEWLDAIERQRPDCLVLNHPHNPSGAVLEPSFLEDLLALAARLDITVIGDEHYRFLASEDAPLGPTVYRPGAPRTFVTGSFIKCLGCPGLRVGWCVGPTDALAAMQNEKNYTTHTVNPLSEWIAWEVMKAVDSPAMRAARGAWSQNRATLRAFLAGSRALYGAAPDGGLVTALGFRGVSDVAGFERALAALDRHGVFVLPLTSMEVGAAFDRDARSPLERGLGVRLGLGAPVEDFREALATMERALAR